MSEYTTEVRFICENYAGLSDSKGYDSVDDIVGKAREKVFDFDFPIYDDSYASVLETKFLKHYYTREIGFETVGLWKLWLNKRLNEIMPYYNQLYKSALLEFNPFYDVDVYTEGSKNGKFDEATSSKGTSKDVRTDDLKEATNGKVTRTDNLKEATNGTVKRTDNLSEDTTTKTTGHSDSTRTDDLAHTDTTTTSASAWDEYSDTPQGALNGVRSLEYLTTARHTSSDTTEANQGSNTGTQRNYGDTSGTGTGKVTNTGTQTSEATDTKANTGTQTNESEGSKANTGTHTSEGNTTGNGTRQYTNVDDYLEHVYGKRGSDSYAKLLTEYRKTFMNIDMMIIEELSDLFMNVW